MSHAAESHDRSSCLRGRESVKLLQMGEARAVGLWTFVFLTDVENYL